MIHNTHKKYTEQRCEKLHKFLLKKSKGYLLNPLLFEKF